MAELPHLGHTSQGHRCLGNTCTLHVHVIHWPLLFWLKCVLQEASVLCPVRGPGGRAWCGRACCGVCARGCCSLAQTSTPLSDTALVSPLGCPARNVCRNSCPCDDHKLAQDPPQWQGALTPGLSPRRARSARGRGLGRSSEALPLWQRLHITRPRLWVLEQTETNMDESKCGCPSRPGMSGRGLMRRGRERATPKPLCPPPSRPPPS